LPMGVLLGLLIGKPVGIFLFSWGTTKLGFAEIPKGVTWTMLAGVACLGGIGFTMAMFINSLAYQDPRMIMYAKVGIFVGSILSAALGFVVLRYATRRKKP